MVDSLISYLTKGDEIHTIKDAQEFLKDSFGIKISRSYLYRLVTKSYKLSYKQIYSVSKKANSERCLIERQWAAHNFIQMMKQDYEIINIDESSIQILNYIRKGWSLRGQKRYNSNLQRINQINIIAGVSNKGTVYYSLSRGKNNSQTVYYFLLNLIQYLETQNPNWRRTIIVMLDNAAYHRSNFLVNKLKELQVPYAFLGPYQFELAPVEKFLLTYSNPQFQTINNLPQKSKIIQSQTYQLINSIDTFMEFLAREYQKFDNGWVKEAYFTCLNCALKQLYNPKI